MQKVRTIIDECTRELNRINDCLGRIRALNGARKPLDSAVEATMALGHADALSARLRGLIIRYRGQLDRSRAGKVAV